MTLLSDWMFSGTYLPNDFWVRVLIQWTFLWDHGTFFFFLLYCFSVGLLCTMVTENVCASWCWQILGKSKPLFVSVFQFEEFEVDWSCEGRVTNGIDLTIRSFLSEGDFPLQSLDTGGIEEWTLMPSRKETSDWTLGLEMAGPRPGGEGVAVGCLCGSDSWMTAERSSFYSSAFLKFTCLHLLKQLSYL